jgi:hypothetical protein
MYEDGGDDVRFDQPRLVLVEELIGEGKDDRQGGVNKCGDRLSSHAKRV